MPHGDIMPRVTKKDLSLSPYPAQQFATSIRRKGLLRLPPFDAQCLLISIRDLWASLPRIVLDVGLPPPYPKCFDIVWYQNFNSKTVLCFLCFLGITEISEGFNWLRHWGWSRPCSSHHQWVSDIRYAPAHMHPFHAEGEQRIINVLRQTIGSVHVKGYLKRSPGWGPHGEKDQLSFSNNIYPRCKNSRLNVVIWADLKIIASQRFMVVQNALGIWLVLASPSGP